MGWFDKHKQGADGKSGEDQSKAEMDAYFERFTEAVDKKLEPLRTEFGALKSDWETIKAEATKTAPPDTRPRDENGNVREFTEAEKRANLDKALATGNIQNAARFIERDVLDALEADFADLKPTIREMFKNTPVERKILPDYAEYCENCVDLAIAKEARKKGLRRNSTTGEFFLEDKSAGSNGDESSILNDPSLVWHYDTPQGPRTMTAKEQLAKLHIDPKDFEDSARKGRV